jgi:hypothetical protein
MRSLLASVTFTFLAFLSVGCMVYRDRPVDGSTGDPPVVEDPAPVAEGPVTEGPGVEVIDAEPPPPERVYVYDPGYPPGVYFYNNYYWYGGYRYERDVFINRVVNVNIRENRYVNVTENRRVAQRIQTGVQRPTQVRRQPAVQNPQNPQNPKKAKKPGQS